MNQILDTKHGLIEKGKLCKFLFTFLSALLDLFICYFIITTILGTWVTGWCLSTTMELMGGATPMTCRLPGLRPILPSSERPVIRAVTVFEAFCWPAVTARTLVCGSCYKNKPNWAIIDCSPCNAALIDHTQIIWLSMHLQSVYSMVMLFYLSKGTCDASRS